MGLATVRRDTRGRTVGNAPAPTTARVTVSVLMASVFALPATGERTALSSPASTTAMAEARASTGCVSVTQATKAKTAAS